ncbi:hypothetical protein BM526_09135 [Alteromonas mediterranea]|uniref:hypothetical protein n=1 Tax=Alteromonas mediterranea TaxID=314275 RepID=UPI0009035D13|nr:hypothetical protein [Alteromonas mediterranea]APE01990.1 hypothetical protein BM526_09135 [Alteromonas mediterranea]
MANLDKDTVIAAFSDAYKKAHGKAPNIEAKSGWYSVDGGKNVRLAQLQEMVDSMSSQTTTKKEAKASSTPSKKKASGPAKSGFSVKEFWAEKLNAEVPGATLPR